MSRLELLAYRSWYGPFRRPFRAVARRLTKESSRIVWGPLKGQQFTGRELVCRMGIYELHVQYKLKELLNEGDVYFDVGANNGYLSLLGAKCVGLNGMVYSIEPLPQNARSLQKLMDENLVENCQLIEKAVSNRSGMIEFYLGDDYDPYTPSLIRGRRSQVMNVGVMTLDDFANDHRWPDLIKLDVEGAEVMALEGAKKILASANAPKWLIEVHSKEIDQEVRKILIDHGYRLCALPAPFPRKPYPIHVIAE
ncbi:MAG: FkbM family methyltransferase [Acidobacteria bacterium]|nr:FkbM family methyltransferase [Acidobacteriota bacterium]